MKSISPEIEIQAFDERLCSKTQERVQQSGCSCAQRATAWEVLVGRVAMS